MVNYYNLLGLRPQGKVNKVNDEEFCNQVSTAYRKKAKTSHPDRFPEEEKEQRNEEFMQLREAKEVLCDPEKRSEYDIMTFQKEYSTSQFGIWQHNNEHEISKIYAEENKCQWPFGMDDDEKRIYVSLQKYYKFFSFETNRAEKYNHAEKYCTYTGFHITSSILLSLGHSLGENGYPFMFFMEKKQDFYEYLMQNSKITSDDLSRIEFRCALSLIPATFIGISQAYKTGLLTKNTIIYPLVQFTYNFVAHMTAEALTGFTGKPDYFANFQNSDLDASITIFNAAIVPAALTGLFLYSCYKPIAFDYT